MPVSVFVIVHVRMRDLKPGAKYRMCASVRVLERVLMMSLTLVSAVTCETIVCSLYQLSAALLGRVLL